MISCSLSGRQPWPVMNSLLYIDLDDNMLGDSLERGKFSNLNVVGTLKLRNNKITRFQVHQLLSTEFCS